MKKYLITFLTAAFGAAVFAGTLIINGEPQEPTSAEVQAKADKVPTATEDNLVAFDDEGNIKDSGRATPDQDLRKADTVTFAGVTTTGTVTAVNMSYTDTHNSTNWTLRLYYDAEEDAIKSVLTGVAE